MRKKLDPRNTKEKKFLTHEIPTTFGPTKYPQEKIVGSTKYPRQKFFDQQNTSKGTMALQHENHGGTRLKKFITLSLQTISYILLAGFMFDKNPRLNIKHRMA